MAAVPEARMVTWDPRGTDARAPHSATSLPAGYKLPKTYLWSPEGGLLQPGGPHRAIAQLLASSDWRRKGVPPGGCRGMRYGWTGGRAACSSLAQLIEAQTIAHSLQPGTNLHHGESPPAATRLRKTDTGRVRQGGRRSPQRWQLRWRRPPKLLQAYHSKAAEWSWGPCVEAAIWHDPCRRAQWQPPGFMRPRPPAQTACLQSYGSGSRTGLTVAAQGGQ